MAEEPKPAPKSLRLSKRLVLVLGIIALILVGIGVFWKPFGAAPIVPIDRGPDNFGAFYMCQQFVTDQLKAPASATFPPSYDDGVTITNQGGGKYRVQAFVDSQNGLGAMIRTHYVCAVEYTGNDRWRLTSLDTN
jgi:hypothetical protein